MPIYRVVDAENKHKIWQKSKGFTLIEILVALSISLVLISGMISVLISSKQSYLRKENINQMQENLRVTSELFRKILSMAEAVHLDSNENQIIVSYSGGEGAINCLGNPVLSGKVFSYFYVNNNSLYCSSTYPVISESTQPLADGITAIQFLYGVDSDHDGQVDRYVRSPEDWHTVISVRVVFRLADLAPQQQSEVSLTVAMRPIIFSRLKGDFQ